MYLGVHDNLKNNFKTLFFLLLQRQAIQPGRLTGVFSTNNLSETLTRDYFLLIGRLSSTTEGLRILEKTSGIFQ